MWGWDYHLCPACGTHVPGDSDARCADCSGAVSSWRAVLVRAGHPQGMTAADYARWDQEWASHAGSDEPRVRRAAVLWWWAMTGRLNHWPSPDEVAHIWISDGS